ncbi:MAG: IS66 family insertion sequence element accessory protein TnpA [Chitinophagaceae bacterium]
MEQSITRTRRTRQQIDELLVEFSKAGCTVKEFCEARQISKAAFHRWQSGLNYKSSSREKEGGFAEMVIDSSVSSLFAEVNGIRIYRQVTAGYLKELLP